MKAGDRALICIGDKQYMCAVVQSSRKSELLLVSEDGEQVASVRQFWRKAEPTPSQDRIEKRTSGTLKACEAPGCDSVYPVRKADLARGWGKTCCKSCAAKLREAKKNGYK